MKTLKYFRCRNKGYNEGSVNIGTGKSASHRSACVWLRTRHKASPAEYKMTRKSQGYRRGLTAGGRMQPTDSVCTSWSHRVANGCLACQLRVTEVPG